MLLKKTFLCIMLKIVQLIHFCGNCDIFFFRILWWTQSSEHNLFKYKYFINCFNVISDHFNAFLLNKYYILRKKYLDIWMVVYVWIISSFEHHKRSPENWPLYYNCKVSRRIISCLTSILIMRQTGTNEYAFRRLEI